MDKPPDEPNHEMDSISRLIERFEQRLRLQRAVAGLVEGACLGLMIAGVAIAAIRTGWADVDRWWMWAIVAAIAVVAASLFRALQPIDPVAAAQRIDRTHGLHDRLSTAMALAQRNDLSRDDDAFVRAQLRDAIHHADAVDPRHAAPWRRPPDTTLLVLVALAVVSIGLLPMAEHEESLPDPFTVEHRQVLDDATLALERDRLHRLRQQIERLPDDEAEALADEIEELLDAVEAREISEREFIDRIDELVEKYFGDDADQRELQALSEALADAALQTGDDHKDTLSEHAEMQRAMEALEEGDFQTAAEELAALAERLDSDDLSAEEAEQLADILESFAEHLDGHEERLQDLFEEHRDTFEDLADQFDMGEGDIDEQLLDDARQQMEDAANERDDFDQSSARRQLDQLSRELEETAEQLRDDQEDDGPGSDGDSSDDGQQGPTTADDDAPEGQDQQSPDGSGDADGDGQQDDGQADDDEPDYRNEIGRQLDDASRQLEEMEQQRQRSEQREQSRRQLEEMRESMSRSDGEGSERDERRGEQVEDFMDRARGDDPQQQGGEAEPNGDQQGSDAQGGEGEGEDGGDAAGQGGPDDDDLLGDGESRDGPEDFQHTREQLDSENLQEGESRSEVIRSASEQGFATTEYQDVYADYEAIAEEVMERESVPDGYRYYIKRYFQLIRPQQ